MQAAGVDVIDIGMVATGMLYFATFELGHRLGVMVTGSHNPPDYNGLKMMLGGETPAFGRGDLRPAPARRGTDACQRSGQLPNDDIRSYLARIAADIRPARPMNIAVDCGNGVAGAFAPAVPPARLQRGRPSFFCDVDGTFPNHHPDPAHPETSRT